MAFRTVICPYSFGTSPSTDSASVSATDSARSLLHRLEADASSVPSVSAISVAWSETTSPEPRNGKFVRFSTPMESMTPSA